MPSPRQPNLNICVYATEDEPIRADVVESTYNPIRIRIGGGGYPFQELNVFLSDDQAERLYYALGAALIDLHEGVKRNDSLVVNQLDDSKAEADYTQGDGGPPTE